MRQDLMENEKYSDKERSFCFLFYPFLPKFTVFP